jgi:hypothetical protein
MGINGNPFVNISACVGQLDPYQGEHYVNYDVYMKGLLSLCCIGLIIFNTYYLFTLLNFLPLCGLVVSAVSVKNNSFH